MHRNSQYRSYRPAPPVRRPKRRLHRRVIKFGFKLFLVVCLLGGLWYGYGAINTLKAHSATPTRHSLTATQRASRQATYTSAINSIIADNPDITFSVATIDLNNGSSQQLGSSLPFEAASTAKLITACLYLHQVETGDSSLSQYIGGGTAKYELQQLIQESDDSAWQSFNDYLGHDALVSYADSIGMTSYDPTTGMVTASDIAKLLSQLYKQQLLNKDDTQLLLSFMQNTNYEDFIPPAIPSGDTFYHKVGLIDDEVHDAAIIDNSTSAFVLVIFTDGHGTYDDQARASEMQAITRAALTAYMY